MTVYIIVPLCGVSYVIIKRIYVCETRTVTDREQRQAAVIVDCKFT